MILVVHVGVALSSILYTTYVFFSPSKTKLTITYFLIAATVATGTSLVFINPMHLSKVCTVGLVYLIASFSGIALIRMKMRRLATE